MGQARGDMSWRGSGDGMERCTCLPSTPSSSVSGHVELDHDSYSPGPGVLNNPCHIALRALRSVPRVFYCFRFAGYTRLNLLLRAVLLRLR